MTFPIAANIFAISLSIAFAATGLAHLAGPAFLRDAYRRWQYASSFRYVVGFAQLLAALFLGIAQTRIWGGTLAAMILFVTVVSLLNRRHYLIAIPAILVLAALAPAMAAPG